IGRITGRTRSAGLATAGAVRTPASAANHRPTAGPVVQSRASSQSGEEAVLKEFKAFVLRGNVVDLAVAVVIGVAFGAVITSFTNNILTPLIGIIGKKDFADFHFTINDSVFRYGL